MAYIGNSPANVGNYQIVDDISSSFNGSLTSFALTVGSIAITPAKSGQLLVGVNGVMQEPDDTGANGFKVSSSNIVFSSAPLSGDTFWAVYQGQEVDIGVPSDDVVDTVHIKDDAVTAAKLANSINTEIAANTAKVTNATHTGDVTGATALTIGNDKVVTAMILDDNVTADKLANSINTDIATGVTANTTANAALPKSGGAMTGTITNFTSTGINDDADATAITIDSAEQVYISNSNNGNNTVHIKALNAAGDEANLRLSGNVSGAGMGAGEVAGSLQYFNNTDYIASISGMRDGGNEGQLSFKTRGGSDAAPVEQLKITKDGRGLSNFTAKAWVRFNGSGTVSIQGSHNVSSITDNGTGLYTVNYSNNMTGTNYTVATTGENYSWDTVVKVSQPADILAGSCKLVGVRVVNNNYEDSRLFCMAAFGGQ